MLRTVLSRTQSSTPFAARGIVTAKLPDLPYDFGALAPVISGEIMQVHHTKHHAAYVANFNIAMEQYAEAESKGNYAKMIALQGAIKFNGGGHVNHSLFWKNLCPPKDFSLPSGDLDKYITKDFKSLDELQKKFSAAAVGVQGSGWGWLMYDKAADKLVIGTTANQDPASTLGMTPVLGVDVWEHAYYLQYKNVRPDYMKAVWQVVNWKNVAENLAAAKA